MIQTYKGILRGNQIEWNLDGGPKTDRPVPVEVIVVDSPTVDDHAKRGREMAEALEKIAALGTFDHIKDPVQWQKEQRVDRPLPGRE